MTEARRSLVAYFAAVFACAVILVYTMELWRVDLHVPLAYGRDALCTHLWAKGIIENGWYLSNPALGAPFGQEMHDFPLADGLFFLAEAALARVVGDFGLLVNLYYFATYFLTTIVTTFVLRRFDIPRGPAVVLGLLYAFAPYHFFRGEQHLFLGSYFLVPPAAMLCLWLIRDGELLYREREGGRARLRLGNRRAVGALVIGLLLGSGGVYYAFFACYLLMVAGLIASISRRRLHPLGSAALIVATIAAAGVVNLAPSALYAKSHGPNPAAVHRTPGEVDALGLRMAQMLLPVPKHRIEPLARLRAIYDRTQVATITENGGATLGLIGGLGFLGLLGVAVYRRPSTPRLVRGLASLNLAALLLATVGGLGSVFGLVVSPLIRYYSRMCVFLSFFAMMAVALVLAKVVVTAGVGRRRLAIRLGLGAILVIGVLDQTSPKLVPEYEDYQANFAADAEFVARVESKLPPGSMVFQLPLIDFPEGPEPGKMGPYDHARAYLHSKSLRWSFGAMRGRYGDAWLEHAADRPLPETLRMIALAGFSGVWVDRAGYADRGAAIEEELVYLLGSEPSVSRYRRFVFFDLTPYVAELRRDLGPDRWASESQAALRPMILTWNGGFYEREEAPGGHSWHWSNGSGQVHIANPSDRSRRVLVTMSLATMSQKPAKVAITGPDGTTEFTSGEDVSIPVRVPPNGTALRFRSNAEKVFQQDDPRVLAFRVERFRISDLGHHEIAQSESLPTPAASPALPRDRKSAEPEEPREPMSVTWHDGFYGREDGPDGLSWRWSSGSGKVRIANPSGRAQLVEVSMGLIAKGPRPAKVTIDGPEGRSEFETGKVASLTLEVPPYGATLRFGSDAERVTSPADPRTLAFRVEGLRIKEVEDRPIPVAAGETVPRR